MLWNREDSLWEVETDTESEALQTDIQRFVAILGFCLMAVFALVQAIPVTAPKQHTVIKDLSHVVDRQREELESLRSENGQLKTQISLLQQDVDTKSSAQEELREAEEQLSRLGDQVERMLKEKVERQKDLLAYKKELGERDKKIRKLQAKNGQVKKVVENVSQDVELRYALLTYAIGRKSETSRTGEKTYSA